MGEREHAIPAHNDSRLGIWTLRYKVFCDGLRLVETRRKDVASGRFTLVFLATKKGEPEIELTHNWDQEDAYSGGRNFGHLAYAVDDIYATYSAPPSSGVPILRPPRDGRMAFVRSDQFQSSCFNAMVRWNPPSHGYRC